MRSRAAETLSSAAASAAADAQAKADALRETVGSAVASPGPAQVPSLSSTAGQLS